MHRLRKLTLAALVALIFTACDEGAPPPVEPDPPPPAVGTISGVVTIEGNGVTGITATLSSGATTATGAGGNFSFAGVEEGSYTVTISGFAEDATFPSVTQSATIATDGQTVQLNFPGQYIRSSAVVGSVVASDAMMMGGSGGGQPETLAGVTVTLLGDHAMADPQQTDTETGGFSFSGLRAGSYTVEISDFPEDISFEAVSMTVEVDVGDVGTVDFEGHYIRTSAIEGQVIIEGDGLQGVMVTLAGGPSNDNYTKMTGADGRYAFTELRPGDYMVSLSGYDPADYEFAATSQDVSVGLDETETVSFTGELLRTAGISGRVSVEGMGLPNIPVTLSGAADGSTMTDASGQYAFAGLAAGDYTVSIAVAGDAYVFGAMSSDVSVADEESAIVNFEAAHATTASVSGMLFIDELNNNDAHDAGEYPLARAGIPLALVGPGVNEQRLSATNADGQFMFEGLRAGAYQLIVQIDAQVRAGLAAADLAYGGPATGYGFALAVGEAKTQAVPFNITHTTVNFSVSLKSGEEMGDALPGASVTLYGTGNANVGSGMTGEDGSVAIKVARASTSGDMVNAGVSADGYDVADGMTAVSWDRQMFATAGSNDNDIVNLNVDVSISGATVTTEYGGGDALAGWAIDVMMGDAAAAGAPTALGDDGSVAFTTTVASVPASFTFSAADDQDDELDGGEMYEASGGMYTHSGLSLAGTSMDADPIVVTYTTQTLKVYVHHERDQVRGYTGNVLGGDVRMSGLVDLEVRHASGNGGRFTSPISSDDWDSRANSSGSKGAYTFAHLPADMDIVVHATAMDDYMLLDLHGLDTYRNMAENGVMGGAFGAMGGWGHTVTLCPLTEVEPTGQDFGECGSFAVVSTYDVSANVSKMRVRKSGAGFHSSDPSNTHQSGVTVSLTPTPGKNLGGVGGSFTTASSNDPTTDIDERRAYDFGTMAAGAYDLGLPDGWMGMVGGADAEAAGGPLSPLGSDVQLDVTPSTATLYGFVRNTDQAGLANVTVTVNGMTATTDDLGRYIVSGISAVRDQLFVNTARAGYPATRPDSTNNSSTAVPTFEANTAKLHNFKLSGANNTIAITGTVTESGTGAGIKGVRIKVAGQDPLNGLPSGSKKGQLLTGDDGTYTAVVAVQPNNAPIVNVSASKSGYHFQPPLSPVAAIVGANPTANFTGYAATEITGRVTAPGGNMSMSDVMVTAYSDPGRTTKIAGGSVTTTETGTFSVFVPTLSGTVYLKAEPRELKQSDYSDSNYQNLVDAQKYVWFDPPTFRLGGAIAVIPGQLLQFGTFKGYSVQPRITGVRRGKVIGAFEGTTLVNGEPMDTIVVTWKYDTRSGTAAYSAEVGGTATLATDSRVPSGVTTPDADARPATAIDGTTSVTHTRVSTYNATAAADYGEIEKITVSVAVIGADVNGETATAAAARSGSVPLSGVAHGASGVTVTRKGNKDAATDSIAAFWSGPGSPALEHRIALLVKVGTENDWEWVVVPGTVGGVTTTATRDLTPGTPAFGKWALPKIPLQAVVTASDWVDDDNPSRTYAGLISDDLRAATQLRVDTRVTGSGDWNKGTPAAIPPSG